MENWKDVNGYEGLYQISDCGSVRCLMTWDVNARGYVKCVKTIKPVDNGNGYLYVTLHKNNRRKNKYIHRLVAEHFIKNPMGKKVVNHKDYNKYNNSVDNLEWVSQRENIVYSSERMKKRHNVATNTGERYITYRKDRGYYRLSVRCDGKERVYKTLGEAVKERDELLKKGVI